jgi:hypothetical protein
MKADAAEFAKAFDAAKAEHADIEAKIAKAKAYLAKLVGA